LFAENIALKMFGQKQNGPRHSTRAARWTARN
jgi:hypothetical protein